MASLLYWPPLSATCSFDRYFKQSQSSESSETKSRVSEKYHVRKMKNIPELEQIFKMFDETQKIFSFQEIDDLFRPYHLDLSLLERRHVVVSRYFKRIEHQIEQDLFQKTAQENGVTRTDRL